MSLMLTEYFMFSAWLGSAVLGFQRDSVISVVVMAAPKITLTYFNIEAAAEKVRLALVMTGTPFEDKRVWFGVGFALF